MTPALCQLARINLLAFVKATFPDYDIGWVHREICGRLMAFFLDVQEKRSPRLIITMPPRHGKSQLVSKHFSAWCFGINPKINIISASYSDSLAKRVSKDVQRIISSEEFIEIFPKTSFRNRVKGDKSTQTSTLFEIPVFGGSFRSAGIGSGITGMGCDILNIDDPFKDRKEADSPTIRERVWDWYASTAYTRLSPGGGVIVTVTRWHEDDLVGRLLKKMQTGGDKWTIINYPAIAEHDENKRKEGEPLHPSRFSLEALENIKRNIGEYEWSALYQQHPTPRSGGLFKRHWVLRYKETPKVFDRLIQSWDLTFKAEQTGDFVAGVVIGQIGNKFYILNVVHERMDFVSTIYAIIRINEKYPDCQAKVIEDKANGSAVIATLKSKIPGIIPFNPRSNKEQRANSIAPLFEAGNVYFPESAPWLIDLEKEMFSFPSAEHDDQVDAITQGLLYLTQNEKKGILALL